MKNVLVQHWRKKRKKAATAEERNGKRKQETREMWMKSGEKAMQV